MKKLLILFLIILIPLVYAESFTEGQSKIIEGKEVKIISIQESKILISVGEEKAILSLNEREIINGIEILLTEIVYIGDETSSASIDTKLTYSCGDNICSESESSETCCKDCGCSGSQKCSEDNICIVPECLLDNECNDLNDLTDDSCLDYICKHKEIKCEKDSECNDYDEETEDICIKSKCQNLPPVCRTDADCEDTNPCTLDQCIDKDCQYKQMENCAPPKETKEVKDEVIKFSEDSKQGLFSKLFSWIKNLF